MTLRKLALALILTGVATLGGIANAAAEKPVMVIRFNQDIVEFERPLDKVAQSALAIKPDAFFELVSIIPQTGQAKQDRDAKANSEVLTGQVAGQLQASGVTPQNIRVTYQASAGVQSNEVHVFVR